MSKAKWGRITWLLLHTIAEKVKKDNYPLIKNDIIIMIFNICKKLPCPICQYHAIENLNKLKKFPLNTKEELKIFLFAFHNLVNKTANKKLFNYSELFIYEKYNIVNVMNIFLKSFNTNGNLKLLTDNFHRRLLLINISRWFMKNINHFNIK